MTLTDFNLLNDVHVAHARAAVVEAVNGHVPSLTNDGFRAVCLPKPNPRGTAYAAPLGGADIAALEAGGNLAPVRVPNRSFELAATRRFRDRVRTAQLNGM